MIGILQQKLSLYSRKMGRLEAMRETEKIIDAGHPYNKRINRLEAKIELIEQLITLYINELKGQNNENKM